MAFFWVLVAQTSFHPHFLLPCFFLCSSLSPFSPFEPVPPSGFSDDIWLCDWSLTRLEEGRSKFNPTSASVSFPSALLLPRIITLREWPPFCFSRTSPHRNLSAWKADLFRCIVCGLRYLSTPLMSLRLDPVPALRCCDFFWCLVQGPPHLWRPTSAPSLMHRAPGIFASRVCLICHWIPHLLPLPRSLVSQNRNLPPAISVPVLLRFSLVLPPRRRTVIKKRGSPLLSRPLTRERAPPLLVNARLSVPSMIPLIKILPFSTVGLRLFEFPSGRPNAS